MGTLPLAPVTLRPSRWLRRLTVLWYGAGLILTLHLPLPSLWRGAVIALVALDYFLLCRRQRGWLSSGCVRINGAHELQLLDAGHWQTLAVLAPCQRWPWLIVLRVARGGRIYRWLLLPDMMDEGSWRHLCVWARWRLPELLPPRPSLWQRVRRRVAR